MSNTSYRPPCKKLRGQKHTPSRKKGKPPTVMVTPGAEAQVNNTIFDKFCKYFIVFYPLRRQSRQLSHLSVRSVLLHKCRGVHRTPAPLRSFVGIELRLEVIPRPMEEVLLCDALYSSKTFGQTVGIIF